MKVSATHVLSHTDPLAEEVAFSEAQGEVDLEDSFKYKILIFNVQCSMHNYQVLGYEGMCFLLEH
jgi:hypothetical protein